MQLEVRLGEFVSAGKKFTILLPDGNYYRPEYVINPAQLTEGSLVGHVQRFPDNEFHLVISRIVQPVYASDEHFMMMWPSELKTRAVLHSWHEGERPTINLLLKFNNIQCHFFKRRVSS
jgi:hypothetical protein